MTINIDPVLITIGSLQIGWYGLMIALAVLVLVMWAYRQIKTRWPEFSTDTLMGVIIVGIPSAIIFARLLHVIDEWEYYSQHLDRLIGGSGLTIYGAILGAVLGTWIYSKFRPFNWSFGADLVAPGILLAQSIGRVGCLINGCCYGEETSLPWAISYIHPNGPLVNGVHPFQLYEIIFLLSFFVILIFLRDRLKPDGSLFLVYLGGYSLWRFASGFLRDNEPFPSESINLFNFNQAQVIGLIVVISVVVILIYRRVRWVKPGETTGDSE